MIQMSLSLVLACAITVIFPWSKGFAQQSSEQSGVTVHGDIGGGASTSCDWTVDLVSFSPARGQRTALMGDGSFQFRDVTPGLYELRVREPRGAIVYSQVVSLSRSDETLSIKIPPSEPAVAAGRQTVSLRELQHNVPRKAIQEEKKGISFLKQRQFGEAAEHLKNAVAIDPQFAAAQNDLGIAYYRLKDYPHSVEHLQRAVELAPGHQPATDNLCLLLLSMKRYAEAGDVAEQYLKRGNISAVAHYALAVSTLAAGGSTAGALDHLRRASDEIPTGHLLAARVLENAGRRTDAAQELQAYLRSQQTGKGRPEVEEWLAALKQ